MKPIQFIFLIAVAILSQFCKWQEGNIQESICTEKKTAPTSEIPDDRVFPVNETINPCDNFYQYACSEAISRFKLRDDRNRHIFAFHDSADRLLTRKKEFLKTLGSDINSNKKWLISISNIYNACMNYDAGKSEELSFVRSTIQKLEKIKSRDDLLDFIADQNLNAESILIDFKSLPNLDNPELLDIVVNPTPLLTLPERSYYYDTETMQAFTGVVTKFFEAIGLDDGQKRAENYVNFEKKLADIIPLPATIRNLRTEKRFIGHENLRSEWKELRFKHLLSKVPKRVLFRDIYGDSLLFINDEFGRLPIDSIKDIYLFNSMKSVLDDAYPDFFNAFFSFRTKHLGGAVERPARDERCAVKIINDFGMELDHEVIDLFFPNFPTDKFEMLVDKIRASMIDRISKNLWLSDKGREGALLKIKTIKMRLVKPRSEQEWDLQLHGRYKNKNRLKNEINQRILFRKKFLESLYYKRNAAWDINPLVINAYYKPADNSFTMPLGILQRPFFDGSKSDPENFGAIGFVVGHEIGHAFDDNGAKYNHRGILEDWMSPEDLGTFKALGTALVDRYDKVGHNGKLTLGENIADTVGLNFAYKASFPKDIGTQEDKKKFFLQYAHLWCGVSREAEEKRLLKTDTHALSEVRTNEPVKHQDGFYEAFSCKDGDNMFIPQNMRLQIW